MPTQYQRLEVRREEQKPTHSGRAAGCLPPLVSLAEEGITRDVTDNTIKSEHTQTDP
jgi:hypothetical protein